MKTKLSKTESDEAFEVIKSSVGQDELSRHTFNVEIMGLNPIRTTNISKLELNN